MPVRVVVTMPITPCSRVSSTVDGHLLSHPVLTKISGWRTPTTGGDYSFGEFASIQVGSGGRAAVELEYSGTCNFV